MKFKKIAAALLAATVLTTTPATVARFSPLGVTANAADTLSKEGDWFFTVNNDGKTVTITDYDGTDTEVEIPRTLRGKTVTVIGDNAFYDQAFVTSVTIPDSVTTIEMAAFGGTSITSITIPNSVTTIGPIAFLNTPLTSITIPHSVTTIGVEAFYNCQSLERITVDENNANYSSINGILFNSDKSKLVCYPAGKKDKSYATPDNVTTIGESAFSHCTSLTNITIPDSVTEIRFTAFEFCESLTSVIIPDSVTTIGEYAFIGTSLTSVTIPDGVTTIVPGVFADCTSLTSITIPDSVTTIGEQVSRNCKSLETVNYGGTKAEWNAIEIDNYNNEYLTNAEIICTDGIINEREPETSDTSEPETSDTSDPTTSDTSEPETSDTSEPAASDTSGPTTSDTDEPEALKPGDYFVDGGLEYTVLKDGTLEVRGFAGDEAKEIVIPETVKGKKVTSIGDAAFMDCTEVTSVTLPSSVTKIGGYAFYGCDSLDTVNYGGRKSDWEAVDIDIENDPLTNAEIKFAEATVEIVDEDTDVRVEISTEDKELDGAEFEVDPADHPTLLDLIKKIIEKVIDTVENVSEDVQKSLDEAAEAVKNGNGFAYDMGFKKDGKEVQPDKSVTVTVPVPEKFLDDIDSLNVYHLTSRGAVYVPSWTKDGSIIFKTKGFSPYVITVEKLANAVAEEDDTVTPGDTDGNTDGNSGSNSGNDQANTGIALAIAPAALACAAVIAASKKRK